MNFDMVSVFFLLGLALWFLLHITDRRRVINGFVFFVSLASFLGFLFYYGRKYDLDYLVILSTIFFMIGFISVPILTIWSTVKLFTSGFELMKKEGVSLSHGLSFLFGLGVLASGFLGPFIVTKLESNILRGIISFLMLCFSYFSFGFIIFLASSLLYRLSWPRYNKDYLIVLGSGLNGNKVTPLLASRIDASIDFYRKQEKKGRKTAKFIMSGGQGKDELVSEAQAMKAYAMEKGIAEEDIICETRSRSTRENLLFSKEIIDARAAGKKAHFFTSDYHVFRAALLAKKLGLDYNGSGSKTKFYFSVSAFIREYIGVLSLHKYLLIFLSLVSALLVALELRL